jgi:threonine synthase
LEAYEDLVAAEVGDTSLTRARNVERETGVRRLFLKFEAGNPTGSQKDRIAFAQVHDALRRGFDAVTLATCGNYGVAMAFAASLAGFRCVVHMPADYRSQREAEIEELGAEVIRTPGDYEAAVEVSRAFAEREEAYDANPGGENAALQMLTYAEIAREIFDEFHDSPAVVGIPVSNGTTLAGIHRGFAILYRRGKLSRLPHMAAGSARRQNPIIRAALAQLNECLDLEPGSVRNTKVNEPLINWHAADGDAALRAIHESDGWAAEVSDRELNAAAKLLRQEEGLYVLPAATAGLCSLLQLQRRSPLPPDRYVVIITSRR